MRILLFGGRNTGVAIFDYLVLREDVVAVVVNPDDGTTVKQFFPSLAQRATEENVPVLQPTDPNDPNFVEQIHKLNIDLIISAEYDLPLGEEYLPPNVSQHLQMSLSLIDKLRGAYPISWAIYEGHKEAGASLFFLTEKPLEIDLVAQAVLPIAPTDTARILYEHITAAAASLFASAWPLIKQNQIKPSRIDVSKVSVHTSYPPRKIEFTGSAQDVFNKIRALIFEPFPGPYIEIGEVRYEIRSELAQSQMLDLLRETVRRTPRAARTTLNS